MLLLASVIVAFAHPAMDPRLAEIGAVENAIAAGHPDPWHSVTQTEFQASGAELAERLPDLGSGDARFELARWVATIGDGHTLVPLLPLSEDTFCHATSRRFLPLRLEWFDDGLYVIGARRDLGFLLGRKVERIGRVDADAALSIALTALPHNTPGFAREYAPEWLMSEDVLSGGGFLTGRGDLKIRVTGAPGAVVDLVECRSFDWLHSRTDGPLPAPDWIALPDPQGPYSGDLISSFRRSGINGLKVFELRVADRDHAESYFLSVLPEVAEPAPFLIDLRDTVGGDGTLIPALLAALEIRLGPEWAERTIVLQGRRTHSAGIMLLSELRRRGVRSVGQRTGDAPSHYGETQVVPLAAFGAVLLHASEFYETDHVGDPRSAIAPDREVPFVFRDYAAGRDRSVEVALAALRDEP